MYSLEVRESVDRIFSKLAKKDPKKMRIIERRVHVDRSFVLTYSINETNKVVIIEDFDHHDKIYLS